MLNPGLAFLHCETNWLPCRECPGADCGTGVGGMLEKSLVLGHLAQEAVKRELQEHAL